METVKIRAATMRDALFQVRRQLGENAVIVSTRSQRSPGVFGVGARSFVEITAAAESESPAVAAVPPEPALPDTYTAAARKIGEGAARAKIIQALEERAAPADMQRISHELKWIRGALEKISVPRPAAQQFSEELQDVYAYLLTQEVAEEIAVGLVQKMQKQISGNGRQDREMIRRQLSEIVRQDCPVCEPIQMVGDRATVVALVGPTGVGKTTTIAKLAAGFSLTQHKRVAVITIDTYRIAAVEQLRTYMDIMEIPLTVVNRPDQMRQAVEQLRGYDVVLIDTAGRSQRDVEQLSQLKQFMAAAQPDEIHLVLSSTVNYKYTLSIIEQFSMVGVNKVLFTKLDEAMNFGLLLNVLARLDKRVSYLTTGQSVPDDLSPASGDTLAELVAGGYGDA